GPSQCDGVLSSRMPRGAHQPRAETTRGPPCGSTCKKAHPTVEAAARAACRPGVRWGRIEPILPETSLTRGSVGGFPEHVAQASPHVPSPADLAAARAYLEHLDGSGEPEAAG